MPCEVFGLAAAFAVGGWELIAAVAAALLTGVLVGALLSP